MIVGTSELQFVAIFFVAYFAQSQAHIWVASETKSTKNLDCNMVCSGFGATCESVSFNENYDAITGWNMNVYNLQNCDAWTFEHVMEQCPQDITCNTLTENTDVLSLQLNEFFDSSGDCLWAKSYPCAINYPSLNYVNGRLICACNSMTPTAAPVFPTYALTRDPTRAPSALPTSVVNCFPIKNPTHRDRPEGSFVIGDTRVMVDPSGASLPHDLTLKLKEKVWSTRQPVIYEDFKANTFAYCALA